MSWHKIEGNSSVMLEAQWIYRTQNAPVCSLKRDKIDGSWVGSFLNRSGISCEVHHFNGAMTLQEVQFSCEVHMLDMGWEISDGVKV